MFNEKYLTIVFGILLIITCNYTGQASLEDTKSSVDLQDVEKLLNMRTEIMNKGLYSNIDISKIVDELKTIERAELLDEDIKILKEIKLSPTDIPVTSRLSIKEVKNFDKTEGKLKFTALIRWQVSYFTEEKYEECLYNIEIEKSDNDIYLSNFNPIE